MRRQIAILALCGLLPWLAGCAAPDPLDRLAEREGLETTRIAVGAFELVSVGRPLSEPLDELVVYFGSDGRPWVDNRPSADPTGRRSLAIELMLRDPRPALYLGRPCYHGTSEAPPCDPSLWTSGRYSDTVVDALVTGLRALIADHRPSRLTLIGYSGGGSIAVLAASRVAAEIDVEVITIAANLDPVAWTASHDLLPLAESLNPVDAVPFPAGFRQVHLVGTADRRVPVHTIRRYRDRQPEAIVLEVEGFDHICCWVRAWPELLERLAAF